MGRDVERERREAVGIEPAVGLCSVCAHGRPQASARGARYWRCLRARSDPRFRPYPPLPVSSCPGYERRGPEGA